MEQGSLTARGAATRERIVEAAAAHVLSAGVAGTSLDDIRASTGTSKSQLFHYFPGGKAELVRALLGWQSSRLLDAQRPDIDDLGSWESWTRWRDAVIAHYERTGGERGCPIGSLTAATPEVAADAAALLEDWRGRLVAGVARLREAGLTTAEPETSGTALLAAIQGGLLLSRAERRLDPLRISLDAALAGLRAA